MFIGELPRRDQLQPEQARIVGRVVAEAGAATTADRIILVQGVAGSGKTTIALSILRELATDHAERLVGPDAITPVLVTYGRRLVASCAQLLERALRTEGPDAVERLGKLNDLPAESSTREIGKLSVFSFTELCRHLVQDDGSTYLGDEECIDLLRRLCCRRRFELLPDQVFGIISAFLKGHRKIRGLTIPELKSMLDSSDMRLLRTQREHLLNVSQKLLGEYSSKLGRRRDRADLADFLCRQLVQEEVDYRLLRETSSETLHAGVLGQSNAALRRQLTWLSRLLADLSDVPCLRNQVDQLLNVAERKAWQLTGDEWVRTQAVITAAVSRYGMRATPLYEAVGRRLRNPVFLVDEVQDLGETELDALVRTWFHLERSPASALVMFGDINQTMTPTGFSWERVIQILHEAADGVNTKLDFGSSLGFVSADVRERVGHSFLSLPNNYRSSEEVAAFAQQMMIAVSKAQQGHWGAQLIERLLRNVVDPRATLPVQIEDDYERTPAHARKPAVIVGAPNLLREALHRVMAPAADNASEGLLVILVGSEGFAPLPGRGGRFDAEMAGLPIAFIPLLGAKGLEFPGVVVAGLPTSVQENDAVDPEIVAQWYTAITRARIRLLVYLSPAEYEVIRRAGWAPLDEYTVPPDQLDLRLQEVGQVQLSEAAYLKSGDYYLQLFRQSNHEQWLRAAIRAFQAANDQAAVRTARVEGARSLEELKRFERAREYYRECDDTDGEVRCRLAMGSPEDVGAAVSLAERLYSIGDKAGALSAMSQIWRHTQASEHGLRAFDIAKEQGQLEAAWRIAAVMMEGRADNLGALAELAQKEEPGLAFRCLWEAGLVLRASALLEESNRGERYGAVRAAWERCEDLPDARRAIILFVDRVAKEVEPAAGARYYLEAMGNPVQAAAVLRGFVTRQLELICELGVFRSRRPLQQWFRIGYRRWLDKARSTPGSSAEFRRRIADLASIAPREDALLQLAGSERDRVEALVPALVREWQLLPRTVEEAKRWIRTTVRAVHLLSGFTQVPISSREQLERLLAGLEKMTPEHFAILDDVLDLLPEIAVDLARGVSDGRATLTGRRSDEENQVVAAKIHHTYFNEPWYRKPILDDFLVSLWGKDFRAAVRCHAEVGRPERAMERVALESSRWPDAVAILFPNSVAEQQAAMGKLTEMAKRGTPTVVEKRRRPATSSVEETTPTAPSVPEKRAPQRKTAGDLSAAPEPSGDRAPDRSPAIAPPSALLAEAAAIINGMRDALASLELAREDLVLRDEYCRDLEVAARRWGQARPAAAQLVADGLPLSERLLGNRHDALLSVKRLIAPDRAGDTSKP